MTEEYPDHWLEAIVKKVEARNPKDIIFSTGKTPSGHIHMGILRELVICDSLRRIFEKRKKKVIFRIFFDDLDAAKRFPEYIDRKFAKENLGKPFALIPPPLSDIPAKSFGEYFGLELFQTFKEFGIKAEPLWSHELYKKDEMKKQIRIGLKNSAKVKEIVLKYITASQEEDDKEETVDAYHAWMPAMVICEKCNCTQKRMEDGTIVPNRVHEYLENDDKVTYECPACGYKGSVSINSGLVKLNWRLDWPAKWQLFNTTLEPAGKDHTTVGGSFDTGLDLCKQIYNYEGPIPVGYEWLRLGDRDMKTSKGIVFTPKKYLSMAEPQLIKMLILRTDPNRHISFRIEELAQLYDEFERIERIYYGLEEAENETIKKEIMYYYPLTVVDKPTKVCPPQLPFKFLVMMCQMEDLLTIDNILQKAQITQKIKKIDTIITPEYLRKRLDQTKNWLVELKHMIEDEKDPKEKKNLMMKADFFSVPKTITGEVKSQLDEKQRLALHKLAGFLDSVQEITDDNLKEFMMGIQKEIDIKPIAMFQAIYLILIGTKAGPRLGPFMALLDLDWLRNRFNLT